MSDLDSLRDDYRACEEQAQKLMAQRDEAIAAVRAKYDEKLRDATDSAAVIQKHLRDMEAATALAGREDLDELERSQLADSLGLTLP